MLFLARMANKRASCVTFYSGKARQATVGQGAISMPIGEAAAAVPTRMRAAGTVTCARASNHSHTYRTS